MTKTSVAAAKLKMPELKGAKMCRYSAWVALQKLSW